MVNRQNGHSTLIHPNGRILSTIQTNEDFRIVGRPKQPTTPILGTGLSIWHGIVDEEYLVDLKPWSKAYKVFTEMLDDVVIGTLYESVTVPLMDSKFSVTPASDKQPDIDAADWIAQQTILSKMFSWHDHVEESLTFLPYGFSLSEKVLKKQEDGLLWLSDLIPIGQDTLFQWGNRDPEGNVTGFIQQITEDTLNIPSFRAAPMDKLLHFTFRGHKRNPMGRSLSRGLYRSWYFSKNLQVVEAIGVERDIGNVPVFKLGEGFVSPEDITALKKAAEGLRIDETSYLILPNGVEAAAFGSGGKVYNVREIVRDYHHLIRQRFFMDFVSLGSEGVGTQALAKEVTGFFSLALGSVQRRMMEVWNTQLIPWIFRWNPNAFSGMTELPQISWAKPGKINLQSVSQAISTMVASGVIHTNKALEDHIREVYELPGISDEEVAAAEALQQQLLGPQQSGGVGGVPSVPGVIQDGNQAQKITDK